VLVPAYLGGVIFAIGVVLPFLGTEIFPQIDAGQIQLRLRAPTATRLEATEQMALRTLAIIGEEAPIATSMGLVGVHAPNYPVNLIHQWNSGPEEAMLQIQLKEGWPPIAELREKLRARLAAEFPGVLFSFEPADIVSRVMALGSPTPIEVAVSGKDFAASRAHAEVLRGKLAGLKDLRDVQFSQTLDYPSVDVTIDRERAGLLGVKMSDATRSLVAATASSRFTVPNYWADPKSGQSYSLQVQVPQVMPRLVKLPSAAGTAWLPLAQLIAMHSAELFPGFTIAEASFFRVTRNWDLSIDEEEEEDLLKAVKPLGAHGLGSFGGHSVCKPSRPLQ
jgi:multidrug efflux pump subunit AcrB